MRLDYKSPLKNLRLRSFISRFSAQRFKVHRFTVHSVLGCVAVLCLVVALYPGQKNLSDDASLNSDLSTETITLSLAEQAGNKIHDEDHSTNKASLPAEKRIDAKNNKKESNVSKKETKAKGAKGSDESKSSELKTQDKSQNSDAKSADLKTQGKNQSSDPKSADLKTQGKNQSSDPKSAELKTQDKNQSSDAKNAELKTQGKNQSTQAQGSEDKEAKANSASDPNANQNQEKAEWQTIKIQKNDTLAKVFQRHKLSQKDLKKMMTSNKAEPLLRQIQPGQSLKLQITDKKQVEGLIFEIGPGNTLNIARKGNEYEVSHQQLPVEKKIAFGKGEIHASLVSSAKRAGLDNNIVSQMVEIFGGNIDFSLDLKPHDTFRVLFEQRVLPDGEKIKTGNILAAELINGGKKLQAIRYTDKSGQTGYFSPEGFGLNQAFLRSPVNYTSISSGFGRRRHPVYHKMRAHKGVDYAAPHGTPVQATGNAKVIFAGTRAGYGKVVELQHGARYSTLYAHLSRFAKNIKAGTNIKQGEVIGFVGKTGLATGPHLHYEFRIDGIHRDPLTVNLPRSKLIENSNKQHFIAHAKEMLRLLDVHDQKINVASVELQIKTD